MTFSINTRLRWAFALIIGLFAVSISAPLLQLYFWEQHMARTSSVELRRLDAAYEMEASLVKFVAELRAYVADQSPEHLEKMRALRAEFDRQRERYEQLADGAGTEALRRQWRARQEAVLAVGSNLVARVDERTQAQLNEASRLTMEAFRDQIRLQMQTKFEALNQEMASRLRWAFLARATSFVLIVALGWFVLGRLVRQMMGSLDQLVVASRAVAAGQLETRVDFRETAELAVVGRSFNEMVVTLQAAEKLRASEQKLRDLFDQAAVGVVEGGLTQESPLFRCNRRFRDMLGYTEAEMEGKTLAEITHPADLASSVEQARRLRAGEIREFQVEKRYWHKDGGVVWGKVIASAVGPSGEKPGNIVAFIQDITGRKRAEHALEMMRFCVDRAGDSVFWVAPDGRYLYANDMACASRGYTREELLGLTVFDLDPDFPPEVWAPHWEELKRRGTLTVETRHRAKDGHVFPIEVNANYVSIGGEEFNFATIRDISGRKAAEAALAESQQRLKLALAGTDAGVWDWNMATGETHYDAGWTGMLGFTPEEVAQEYQFWEQRVHPEDKPGVLKKLHAHLKGENPDYLVEHRLRHRDGSWVWVQSTGRIMARDKDGQPLRACGTHLNITKRKLAEAARLEAEQHFQAIFNEAGVGVGELDSRTGRFVQVNRKNLEILGRTEAEMLATDFMTITHPDDLQSDLAFMEQMRAGLNRGFVIEKRLMHRNGSAVWVRLSVTPLWSPGAEPSTHLAVVEDITARKLAEAELRESEQRLELALAGADAGVWDWNVLAGTVTVDHRWAGMVGHTVEEVAEEFQFWVKRVHPEDLPAARAALKAHLKNRRSRYSVEYRLRHKNGSWIWVQATGLVVARDPQGRPLRICGTHLNITARKSMEAALRAGEKLAATGRMAAGIAHEINNPLNGIRNSLLLVERAVPRDHPDHPFLARIQREIERIATITRRMFTLYKPVEETIVEFSLSALLQDIVHLSEATARAHDIRLVCQVPEGPCLVRLPEVSVSEVLYNLIKNAIEASPDGGEVRVELALAPGQVLLSVEDRGPGIPEALRERVFEPFFSTKTGVGNHGLGLGLAAARSHVEAMGGRISFSRTSSDGTIFQVMLPTVRPELKG